MGSDSKECCRPVFMSEGSPRLVSRADAQKKARDAVSCSGFCEDATGWTDLDRSGDVVWKRKGQDPWPECTQRQRKADQKWSLRGWKGHLGTGEGRTD